MAKEMNITEARDSLMKMPDILSEESSLNRVVCVTKHDRKILAIVPWEEYEAIAETKSILADKKTMRGIEKGIKAVKTRKTSSISKVRKKLGL